MEKLPRPQQDPALCPLLPKRLLEPLGRVTSPAPRPRTPGPASSSCGKFRAMPLVARLKGPAVAGAAWGLPSTHDCAPTHPLMPRPLTLQPSVLAANLQGSQHPAGRETPRARFAVKRAKQQPHAGTGAASQGARHRTCRSLFCLPCWTLGSWGENANFYFPGTSPEPGT